MNALQEHIDFSSHYIRQGSVDLQDSDEQELLKPLGSMQVQQPQLRRYALFVRY